MEISFDRASFPLGVEVQDIVKNEKHHFTVDWADDPEPTLVVDGVAVKAKEKPKPQKPGGGGKP